MKIYNNVTIGKGSFGKIVLGQHNSCLIAIKYCDETCFKLEYQMLKKINGKNKHVCKILKSNVSEKSLVFPLYGPSLSDVISITKARKKNQKFVTLLKPDIVAQIHNQMLEAVSFCHFHNIIHLDVKPNNFVLNYNMPHNRVILIDFGLARNFSTNLSRCRSGSLRYMSKYLHTYDKPSFRDDLYSLIYSTIMLYCGKLPWSNDTILKIKDKSKKHEYAKNMKENVTFLDLFKVKTQLSKHLFKCLTYMNKITYAERPTYDKLAVANTVPTDDWKLI